MEEGEKPLFPLMPKPDGPKHEPTEYNTPINDDPNNPVYREGPEIILSYHTGPQEMRYAVQHMSCKHLSNEKIVKFVNDLKGIMNEFQEKSQSSQKKKFAPNLREHKFDKFFHRMRTLGNAIPDELFIEATDKEYQAMESDVGFPKKINQRYIGIRFDIFMNTIIPILPTMGNSIPCCGSIQPNPDVFGVPFNVMSVIQLSHDDLYLGMIAHEYEPGIYRFFDVSKEFSAMLCCPHNISFFSFAVPAEPDETNTYPVGTEVFITHHTTCRFDTKVYRATIIESCINTDDYCYIVKRETGEIEAIKQSFVAPTISPYKFNEETENRRIALSQENLDLITDIQASDEPLPTKKKSGSSKKRTSFSSNKKRTTRKPEIQVGNPPLPPGADIIGTRGRKILAKVGEVAEQIETRNKQMGNQRSNNEMKVDADKYKKNEITTRGKANELVNFNQHGLPAKTPERVSPNSIKATLGNDQNQTNINGLNENYELLPPKKKVVRKTRAQTATENVSKGPQPLPIIKVDIPQNPIIELRKKKTQVDAKPVDDKSQDLNTIDNEPKQNALSLIPGIEQVNTTPDLKQNVEQVQPTIVSVEKPRIFFREEQGGKKVEQMKPEIHMPLKLQTKRTPVSFYPNQDFKGNFSQYQHIYVLPISTNTGGSSPQNVIQVSPIVEENTVISNDQQSNDSEQIQVSSECQQDNDKPKPSEENNEGSNEFFCQGEGTLEVTNEDKTEKSLDNSDLTLPEQNETANQEATIGEETIASQDAVIAEENEHEVDNTVTEQVQNEEEKGNEISINEGQEQKSNEFENEDENEIVSEENVQHNIEVDNDNEDINEENAEITKEYEEVDQDQNNLGENEIINDHDCEKDPQDSENNEIHEGGNSEQPVMINEEEEDFNQQNQEIEVVNVQFNEEEVKQQFHEEEKDEIESGQNTNEDYSVTVLGEDNEQDKGQIIQEDDQDKIETDVLKIDSNEIIPVDIQQNEINEQIAPIDEENLPEIIQQSDISHQSSEDENTKQTEELIINDAEIDEIENNNSLDEHPEESTIEEVDREEEISDHSPQPSVEEEEQKINATIDFNEDNSDNNPVDISGNHQLENDEHNINVTKPESILVYDTSIVPKHLLGETYAAEPEDNQTEESEHDVSNSNEQEEVHDDPESDVQIIQEQESEEKEHIEQVNLEQVAEHELMNQEQESNDDVQVIQVNQVQESDEEEHVMNDKPELEHEVTSEIVNSEQESENDDVQIDLTKSDDESTSPQNVFKDITKDIDFDSQAINEFNQQHGLYDHSHNDEEEEDNDNDISFIIDEHEKPAEPQPQETGMFSNLKIPTEEFSTNMLSGNNNENIPQELKTEEKPRPIRFNLHHTIRKPQVQEEFNETKTYNNNFEPTPQHTAPPPERRTAQIHLGIRRPGSTNSSQAPKVEEKIIGNENKLINDSSNYQVLYDHNPDNKYIEPKEPRITQKESIADEINNYLLYDEDIPPEIIQESIQQSFKPYKGSNDSSDTNTNTSSDFQFNEDTEDDETHHIRRKEVEASQIPTHTPSVHLHANAVTTRPSSSDPPRARIQLSINAHSFNNNTTSSSNPTWNSSQDEEKRKSPSIHLTARK